MEGKEAVTRKVESREGVWRVGKECGEEKWRVGKECGEARNVEGHEREEVWTREVDIEVEKLEEVEVRKECRN